MEKKTEDKSELNTHDISGDNLNKGKRAEESLNEKKWNSKDQPENTLDITPGGTLVGDSDKANIETGLNENKSTVGNTSSPSTPISEK